MTVGENANKQVSASILNDKERPRSASYLIKEDGISRNQVPHQQTECAKRTEPVPLADQGLVRLDDVELGEDVLLLDTRMENYSATSK